MGPTYFTRSTRSGRGPRRGRTSRHQHQDVVSRHTGGRGPETRVSWKERWRSRRPSSFVNFSTLRLALSPAPVVSAPKYTDLPPNSTSSTLSRGKDNCDTLVVFSQKVFGFCNRHHKLSTRLRSSFSFFIFYHVLSFLLVLILWRGRVYSRNTLNHPFFYSSRSLYISGILLLRTHLINYVLIIYCQPLPFP